MVTLTLLGSAAGFIASLVILLFRFLIEYVLQWHLGDPENFEALDTLWHFLLPMAGASTLAFCYYWIKPSERRSGIPHVIERVHLFQGVMHMRGFLVQFFAGAITLLSGLSMGREGPAVHLGAASGSLLGQWATLPNNSVRVLTSCGCAAAISASFSTPMAGVIFAIEVIMMEYHLPSLIPIIISAVIGESLVRLVYGNQVAFTIPSVELISLAELPLIVICGVLVGSLAALLIFLSRWSAVKFHHVPHAWRFVLAGLITALCAACAPQIMGTGYDTIDKAIAQTYTPLFMMFILLLKLLATSACVGAGFPGGVIGPTLVLGALSGGIAGLFGQALSPDTDAGLYALLGMAAMMAATLQAPLSSLIALLELTDNPHVIFPGMLAVVTACLISAQLFRQPGIFVALLGAQGIHFKMTPLDQQLRSTPVTVVMNKNIATISRFTSLSAIRDLLRAQPEWILIEDQNDALYYMLAADVVHYLGTYVAGTEHAFDSALDMFEIVCAREQIHSILMNRTLEDALNEMCHQHVDALCVKSLSDSQLIIGLIRKQDIEHFY